MIMDYEIEIMLRQSVPGYGKSILMVVSAADTAAAQEEAKGKYAAITGLPLYLIESVEAAPIIPLSEEKIWEQVLEEAAKREGGNASAQGGG